MTFDLCSMELSYCNYTFHLTLNIFTKPCSSTLCNTKKSEMGVIFVLDHFVRFELWISTLMVWFVLLFIVLEVWSNLRP